MDEMKKRSGLAHFKKLSQNVVNIFFLFFLKRASSSKFVIFPKNFNFDLNSSNQNEKMFFISDSKVVFVMSKL